MDWVDRYIVRTVKASASRSAAAGGNALRRYLTAARQAVETWVSARETRLLLGVAAVVFLMAALLPQGWVRSVDGIVAVNLIDFFIRGVLVPEAILLTALLLSWLVRLPGTRTRIFSVVGAAWYLGVLVGSLWLFFVEHVQGSIATTFVDFLSADRLVRFLGLLALPWRPFGLDFDFPVMVEAATGTSEHSATVLVMWRNFVLLALATYAVLPRALVLLGLTLRSAWRGISALRSTRTIAGVVERDLRYERPARESLDWFRTVDDEGPLIKALILSVLRRDAERPASSELAVLETELAASLNAAWRDFLAADDEWTTYLRDLDSVVCPKLNVLAFDVLRFNFVARGPGGEIDVVVDRPKVRRELTQLLSPKSIEWDKIDSALAHVERYEAELAREQGVVWRRLLYALGIGAVAGAGAIACAPFLGASAAAMAGLHGIVAVKAGLAALGTGAVAKGGLGLIGSKIVVGVMSTVGAGLAGHTSPEGPVAEAQRHAEERARFVMGYVARCLALIDAGVVPAETKATLKAWLTELATAKVAGASGAVVGRQEAKVAKRALELMV